MIASTTQPIKLIDAARYYKSLDHQIKAAKWYQDSIESEKQEEFAKRYRNSDSGKEISFANAFKYFEARKHQVEALNWLQENTAPETLIEFARLWRSAPPPKMESTSNYYQQMTHNGTRLPQTTAHEANIRQMVAELEKLEQHLGVPLVLTSGYRPEPINSQIGGAPGSQHTLGKAADFYSPKMDDFELERKVIQYWYEGDRGGLGRGMSYRGFVHIDTSSPRIWDY